MLRQWTKSDITITGTLATDNSGLVDRARDQSKIRYPTPNAVFQPDWDVIEAIVSTVENSSMEVAYTWVKGHQDKKRHTTSCHSFHNSMWTQTDTQVPTKKSMDPTDPLPRYR